MKTRIIFRHGWFYPQTKRFLFWKHIWWCDDLAAFKLLTEAMDFIESDEYIYHNKVVYEGTK